MQIYFGPKHYLKAGLIVCCVFIAGSISAAEGLEKWKHADKLDEQTQAKLRSAEQFLAQLYEMPNESKLEDANKWMEDLRSGNHDLAPRAAACLGIFRIKEAREVLEATATAKTGDNRTKWIATRSLGLIADSRSAPVLEELLDHTNGEVRLYARVALAEISGVYKETSKDERQLLLKTGTNEPILCRSVECNKIDENEVRNVDVEGAKQIYIIVFKSGSSSIKKANELLKEFNKNMPEGIRTHHFTCKESEEGLTGQISVDGKPCKDAIIEMIAKNHNLVLVKAEQTTDEQSKEPATTNARPVKSAKFIDKDKLSFVLPDALGREIRSEDYTGVPVLIMCGSCWCGGCQQDAEPLRKIDEEFGPKGLAVIRSVSGDNELASLDFAKHYRLKFPQIMDTNRKFEERYNPDGWTFLMLVDEQGKVVYKCNSPKENDWSSIKGLIEKMAKETDINRTTVVEGVRYMPKTLHRSGEQQGAKIRDEFASIASGNDGRVYVVFTTNRNGNSDVFTRFFDGNIWSQDIPISAGVTDEYDGSVIVDSNNRVYVCWTSNAKGGKYNIFLTSFTDSINSKEPVQITDSADDAMHPRMACDDKGRVWITYCKWRKMGEWSRDKEVYIRRNEGGRWSDEIQVSPTDVPEYEDHTEPAIACYGDGAIVCWSWDFHQPEGYTKQASAPTIFTRRIAGNLDMGRPIVVSSKDIDVTPGIGITGGRTWCTWDCMAWDNRLKTYQKRVCVKQAMTEEKQNSDDILSVSESTANICTPVIATDKQGGACVVWCQTSDSNRWILKMAAFDSKNNQWQKSKTVESEGNPRFCSAGFDNEGKLWLAYSVTREQKREIIAKAFDNIGEESAKQNDMQKPREADELPSKDNKKAVEKLRQLIAEKYSYRDQRGVDWDKAFSTFGPLMEREQTPEQFAEFASKLTERARDPHLWIKVGDKSIGGFKRNVVRNYNISTLRRIVPGFVERNKRISTGRFEDGIGYILINNWSRDGDNLEPAFAALKEFSDAPGLIIDVRPNSGGSEPLAEEFAGCFVDEPVMYSKHAYRKPGEPNGFSRPQERILQPNKKQVRYKGKVTVLMGQANMSSCESFLLYDETGGMQAGWRAFIRQ